MVCSRPLHSDLHSWSRCGIVIISMDFNQVRAVLRMGNSAADRFRVLVLGDTPHCAVSSALHLQPVPPVIYARLVMMRELQFL